MHLIMHCMISYIIVTTVIKYYNTYLVIVPYLSVITSYVVT